MKQTFGGANVVTMSLEVKGDQDVFTHETLTKVRMLTEQVDMIKGVNHYQVASIAHPKGQTPKRIPRASSCHDKSTKCISHRNICWSFG